MQHECTERDSERSRQDQVAERKGGRERERRGERHRAAHAAPTDDNGAAIREPYLIAGPRLSVRSQTTAPAAEGRGTSRVGEVLTKDGAWLDAGTKLVWVVDPDREEVRVHRPDGSVRTAGGDNSIDGEDVLPGFTCSVREIFAT